MSPHYRKQNEVQEEQLQFPELILQLGTYFLENLCKSENAKQLARKTFFLYRGTAHRR